MIDFLREEGITETILKGVGEFRRRYSSQDDVAAGRPRYVYYGKEVWEQAITALLCGENLLLAGSKATGKTSSQRTSLRSSGARPIMSPSISIWTPPT